MKRTGLILGIGVLVILAAVLVIPLFVDANEFRPTLEEKLTQSLGRQVKVGDVKLAIFSGSVAASDVSIAEDPAFGATPFLRASQLRAGVELIPLIFSRKLNVTGIVVDKPEIDLIQNAAGAWNFSSLGGNPNGAAGAKAPTAEPPSSQTGNARTDFSIADVKISDGRLTLQRLGGQAKPLILDKVSIEIKNFSEATSSPFSFSGSLAGGGSIKLDGNAGPIVAGDAIDTPLDAKLSISHLDVIASGVLDPAIGIAGVVSVDGSAKSDHSHVKVQGKLKADQVRLSRGGTASNRPLELDFAAGHDLKRLTGTLERADIHVGAAMSTLSGTYNLQTEPASVDLKLSGSKMPLTELAALLPALNIALPAGAEIKQGTLEVSLATHGALDKLVTTGTIAIEKATLAKYDLAGKMKVLDALAGVKAEPQTTIQTLSSDVKNSPEGTALDNVQFVVPSIGQVTGAGTISPAHALDFHMRVAVHSGLASVATLGSKNGIPFTISGTSEDPSFHADVKGLATEELKDITGATGAKTAADAASGLIKGLFGGKKKQ
jgi:AsmA protein